MDTLKMIFSYNLVHATLRSSAPIILATIAAVISHQANIINIGIEGTMLICAFTGAIFGYMTGSWVIGLLLSMAVGSLLGWLVAFGHIKLKADVFIIGFGINMLALGVTRFLLQQIHHVSGSFTPSDPIALPKIHFAVFDSDPVLNSLFNNYSILEPLSIVFIFILWFILYKTTVGLRLRCVGLNSIAAQTAGIDVARTQTVASLLTGLFAGLAGANLSMGYSNMFVENMTSGRGFIALAAASFGANNPIFAMIGCLIFGFSDSLGARVQATSFPNEVILMLPYVVTILILTLAMIRRQKKEARVKQLSGMEAETPAPQ
jgi:simple sugar transport system permease protein